MLIRNAARKVRVFWATFHPSRHENSKADPATTSGHLIAMATTPSSSSASFDSGGGPAAIRSQSLVGLASRGRPTFLEVAATTYVQRTLFAGIAHVVRTCAGPGTWLSHHARAVAALTTAALHAASLESAQGTVGEALYGIRRRRMEGGVGGATTSSSSTAAEAAAAAVDPALGGAAGVLWTALVHACFHWSYDEGEIPLAGRFGPHVQATKGALQLADLAVRVAYLARLIPAPTLEHLLLRQTAAHWTPAARRAWAAKRAERARGRPALARWALFLVEHSSASLVVVLVVHRALAWWFSEGEGAAKAPVADVPPPPALGPPSGTNAGASLRPLPPSPHMCPLCLSPRTNAACLTTSGLVFCYACILPHVRTHKRCPVTGAWAEERHVRRLYVR